MCLGPLPLQTSINSTWILTVIPMQSAQSSRKLVKPLRTYISSNPLWYSFQLQRLLVLHSVSWVLSPLPLYPSVHASPDRNHYSLLFPRYLLQKSQSDFSWRLCEINQINLGCNMRGEKFNLNVVFSWSQRPCPFLPNQFPGWRCFSSVPSPLPSFSLLAHTTNVAHISLANRLYLSIWLLASHAP